MAAEMDAFDLPEEQKQKLKQFTEITNIEDMNVAIGTLASLNWNVEQAIEAHLMQDMDAHDDDPEIIEPDPQQVGVVPEIQPQQRGGRGRRRVHNSDPDEVDNQIHDEDENNGIGRPTYPLRSRRNGQEPTASSSAASGARRNNSNFVPERRADIQNDINPIVIDSDDDSDHDYHDVAADVVPANRARNGLVQLIPDDCEDIAVGLQNFVSVFETRFCSRPPASAFMPHFYCEPLPAAIKEAFEQSDCANRRPLALYIHNEKSIAANIFASQVLCTEPISTLLRHQYVFWPWDVTSPTNFRRLLEWLQVLNMGEVRQIIQRLSDSRQEAFPLIMIVVREKGSFKLVDVCKGIETSDQVIEKLMQGVEEYGNIRSTEAIEKRAREERERLRNEQEAEYHASLAADRARIEKKQREIDEQRLEEERKRKEEEDEAMRRQTVASMLPTEPAATEANIVHVKFRLPEGAQDMRRFRQNEPIRTMIDYLSSKGYRPELFKYFNSDFPKKDVSQHFDLNKTFGEVKWPTREQVFVDEN